MTVVASYADAVVAMLKRDALIYISYRTRFITQILSILFSLAFFYYLSRLITVGRFDSADEYYGFAVVGLAILQMLTSALALVPTAVRQELVAGTFERLVLSPFGPIASIISMLVFPGLLAVLTALLTVGLAAAIFGVDLQLSTAPLAIPAAMLGAFCFAPLALLLAAAVLAIRQVVAGTSMLVSLMALIGGFFFPVSLLPDWIQWSSEVQPFTPTVELLRHLLVGAPLEGSPWLTVLKLLAFAAVLFPVAVVAMWAAIARSQRRGTIIEY